MQVERVWRGRRTTTGRKTTTGRVLGVDGGGHELRGSWVQSKHFVPGLCPFNVCGELVQPELAGRRLLQYVTLSHHPSPNINHEYIISYYASVTMNAKVLMQRV